MSPFTLTMIIVFVIILIIKMALTRDDDKLITLAGSKEITETGTEQYHRIAHASILFHGFATIDRRLKKCKLVEEDREGLHFKFWKDIQGRVVKMERSDGVGYIQLFGVFGDVFGSIWISPNEEPCATVCVNSGEYSRDMKFFLETN